MKYIYQVFILVVCLSFGSCTGSRYYTSDDGYQNYSGHQDEISYQQFYDDLSPYGSWISYQGYGYVWQPSVPGFRPYYSNGHWVYTSYGWTWLSNYSWGWAPFHYGRWMNDGMYGWMWVPGYEWAPAWVSWRGGGDYYGWAPLGPHMGINISMGSIPYNDWAFVPSRYINSPRINNYYVNNSRNFAIINNTTIINNNTIVVNNNSNNRFRPAYNPGPSVKEVESVTRSRIREFNVIESNKPGASRISNNSIRVYRPSVRQETPNSVNTRPVRVPNGNSFEGTRRNENNLNNGSSAPVRVFPRDQRPQINRSEGPVNNNQPTRQQRNSNDIINNRNSRTFTNSPQPQINNDRPVDNNPAARQQRNSNDIINNRNSRTFTNSSQPQLNNEQPASRLPAVTNPLNNTRQRASPDKPVREFRNPPSANINNHSNSRANERGYSTHRETLPPAANNQKREPSNVQQQSPNRSSSSGIRYFNPAQHVERQAPVKQESKE